MLYDITNTSYWDEYSSGDIIWSIDGWVIVSSSPDGDYLGAGLTSTESTFNSTQNVSKVKVSFLYDPEEWGIGDGVLVVVTTTDPVLSNVLENMSGSIPYVDNPPTHYYKKNGWIDPPTYEHHVFEYGFIEFIINEAGSRLVGVYVSRMGGDYAAFKITKIEYEGGSPPVWTSYVNSTEYFN